MQRRLELYNRNDIAVIKRHVEVRNGIRTGNFNLHSDAHAMSLMEYPDRFCSFGLRLKFNLPNRSTENVGQSCADAKWQLHK